ncbi:MAG: aldo/keto reductase [Bryobacterales bacterium]|nr:aldo/keto reductase [Bryobacterales bacterium]
MSTSNNSSAMPCRPLGNTGEMVSVIGIGGWHLGLKHVDEALSIRIIREAMDRGVNFLDNCWDYNQGLSEERMGKALRDGYREKAFVMTKIDGRSYAEAMRQLEDCLRRLETDCIDLVQHHEIQRFEDPFRILDEEGAHAALEDARKAGKLRYTGFTGHKDPLMHLRMLEIAAERGVRFDAVQMPLNVMDAHYRSFARLVLPELVRQGIAPLAMKTMANGHILKSNTVSAIECLQYALNLPVATVITGIDTMAILDQAFEAVRTFQPMSAAEVDALLARTKDKARDGAFELFKTTSIYDGTGANPEWLGQEPKRLRDAVLTI